MSDDFESSWPHKKIIALLIPALILIGFIPALSQSEDVIPFKIQIAARGEAINGEQITFDIIKVEGSEMAHGFDLMIGYDDSKLYNPNIGHGELFYSPGDFEWELLGIDTGPFAGCTQGGCPDGLLEIISLADAADGPHHPVKDPQTGKIRVIPDNTILFSITFRVAEKLDPDERYVPIFFFWTQCTDNQIAFSYEFDGPFDIRSAFSRLVFDSDGLPGWLEITDFNSVFPTKTGAPTDCISGTSERLCDFFNGGVKWGCGDTDSDGRLTILDLVFLIDFKYKNGPGPDVLEYGDVNNDSTIDILDVVHFINYLYKDGPLPQCPQP
jgi:hypothetical protein